MTYDSWKARNPDDDLGDPSMYEKPDPAQELADWEDEKVDGSYFTECNYPKCGCARFGRCENAVKDEADPRAQGATSLAIRQGIREGKS